MNKMGQKALVTEEILDDFLEVRIGIRGVIIIGVVLDCGESCVSAMVVGSCRGGERKGSVKQLRWRLRKGDRLEQIEMRGESRDGGGRRRGFAREFVYVRRFRIGGRGMREDRDRIFA